MESTAPPSSTEPGDHPRRLPLHGARVQDHPVRIQAHLHAQPGQGQVRQLPPEQLRQLVDQVQSRAHRALRIVLPYLGVTEAGEHLAAHGQGEAAAVPPDDLVAFPVEVRLQLSQVLRIQPPRQPGEARELAGEQHQPPELPRHRPRLLGAGPGEARPQLVQLPPQPERRGEASGRVLGQRGGQEGLHLPWHLRVARAHRRHRLLGHHPLAQLREGDAREGQLPGEHLVEHHPGRPHIRPRILEPGPPLLRRHVPRRARPSQVRDTPVAGRQQVRQAEVQQLHRPRWGEEDIARLEVSVDEAALVRVRQPPGDALQHLQRAPYFQPSPFQQCRERLALQALHHQEGQARLVGNVPPLGHVEDADDVLVVQPGNRPGLSQRFRLEARARQEELERYFTLKRLVPGAKDLTHAPAAHPREDVIPAAIRAPKLLAREREDVQWLGPTQFLQDGVPEVRGSRRGPPPTRGQAFVLSFLGGVPAHPCSRRRAPSFGQRSAQKVGGGSTGCDAVGRAAWGRGPRARARFSTPGRTASHLAAERGRRQEAVAALEPCPSPGGALEAWSHEALRDS
jgi:hypothetical protein